MAVDWTEAEKLKNPLRRGFLRATANHHALELANGTPFFVIGDTWYATGANRFKWYDDDRKRPLGPPAGFKDYVRMRARRHRRDPGREVISYLYSTRLFDPIIGP